jgi:hypothetical protein
VAFPLEKERLFSLLTTRVIAQKSLILIGSQHVFLSLIEAIGIHIQGLFPLWAAYIIGYYLLP